MVNQVRSIKELVQEAHDYEYSTSVPIKIYLRTAENLSRHADLYYAQSALSDAYKLYVRFLDLLTNKISKNPQLKKGSDVHKSYLKLLSTKAPEAFANAEQIKTKLEQEIQTFERYEKIRFEQQRIARLKEELKPKPKEPPKEELTPQHKEPEPQHHDFDEEKFASKLRQFQGYDTKEPSSASSALSTNSYPTLEHQHKAQPQFYTAPQTLAPLPTPPPKIPVVDQSVHSGPTEQPVLPPKSEISTQVTKPQHKSIASTEGKIPLKTVYLPSQLPLQFLKIAQQNTSKNLETCGILCGSLSLNAFFITTLLIPHQESTANTCETLNEEEIFEKVDSKDLFVLGWIHTHPTQSCFLSSVDLHTQNSYQIMLPEAIAIVCAVKFGEMGQFRLTDPPGVGIITKCQRSGFHPHEEKNIYKHCESKFGGHVIVKDELPFDVADLRK